MQKMRNFSHFPKSFSLLFTLLLLAGAVIAGCGDSGEDREVHPWLRADVYVDVSAVALDYEVLEAVFPQDGSRLGTEELVKTVDVDENGLGLIAEKQTAGSHLKFALNFKDAAGKLVGVFDRTAEGVRIVPDSACRCVIPVDDVAPVPSPSPTASPSPEPSPSPTASPSPSPTASPSPEPSPSPSPSPDPADVYLKLEGDIPYMGQISVICCGWDEDRGDSVPVTFDKYGVTTKPVAVNKHVGDRLQLGIYFEQKEEWVFYDNGKWHDDQYEYYYQPVYYYENFRHEGKGVIVPEGKKGKSVVVVKFKDEFRIVYDTLITYDLSALDNSWWDDEDYQPNHILLAVHEEGDTEFTTGPKKMRIPLIKSGSGYAPVYLRGPKPGTVYKGYYALENLKVDADGDIIFDKYGNSTCHVIADNGDQAEVMLPEGQTEQTIQLKMSDFTGR